jgi:hypothetical protein
VVAASGGRTTNATAAMMAAAMIRTRRMLARELARRFPAVKW